MAERKRYIVTYDICSPGRLRKVHELVVDHGERLQYSVYICDLTEVELIGLRTDLRETIKLDEDSVSIFDLGPPAGRLATRVEHLGTQPNLPSQGPEIW